MSLFVPAPFVSSGLSYASAIAAITNKQIYLRGDSYAGSNGTAIGSAAWTNGGSLSGTGSFNSGSGVWETNSLNGMPGLKINSAATAVENTSIDFNTLHGTNGARTLFAVVKLNGSQGTFTGDSLYINGGLLYDTTGYAGLMYGSAGGRELWYYHYASGNQATGLSYTDNVPHVIGFRINTSGNIRVNFNGSIYSDATSRTAPSSSAGSIKLLKNNNANNNYIYEFINTVDVLGDGLIDQIVIALKKKWGIT